MVRLASLALMGAALAASFVEASPSGCNCTAQLGTCTGGKDAAGNTGKGFLNSVTTSDSPLNVCAVNAFGSTIPNTTIVHADGTPLLKTDSSVTVLLNILAKGDAQVGLTPSFKKMLTEVQPFGQIGVNTIASKFLQSAAASKGFTIDCTNGSTFFNLTTPGAGSDAILPGTATLCTASSPLILGGVAATFDPVLFGGLYDVIQDYFLFSLATGLYGKLTPCLYSSCKPLVSYLCNLKQNITLLPPVTSLFNTDYASVTLVSSAEQITGLANTVANDLQNAFLKAYATPEPERDNLANATLGLLSTVPASGNPADTTGPSMATAIGAVAAQGKTLGLACSALTANIGLNATAGGTTAAPTGAASTVGASVASAVVAFSAAFLAL